MINISITSICSRNGGEETDITFVIGNGENSEQCTFTLSAQQFLTLGIVKGESDTYTFDTVSFEARVWSAVKRGMLMLACGAVSEKAMRLKLAAKGFDKEVSEQAASMLASRGLIRENEDAARLSCKLADKLWGKKRIISELYSKGYTQKSIAYAICELENSGVDFDENCRRLIKKRYEDIPPDPQGRAKLYAALARYGYSSSEIKQAIQKY